MVTITKSKGVIKVSKKTRKQSAQIKQQVKDQQLAQSVASDVVVKKEPFGPVLTSSTVVSSSMPLQGKVVTPVTPIASSTPSFTKCYHSARGKEIDLGRGLYLSGAARSQICIPSEPCLILNCSGMANISIGTMTTNDERFASLKAHYVRPVVIDLDWSDGDATQAKPEFWINLLSLARQHGIKRLIPYCIGSHGRTGTAMTAIVMVESNLGAFDAVEFVRKAHCVDSVETYAQIAYLEELEMWMFQNNRLSAIGHKDIEPSYMTRKTVSTPIKTYTGTGASGKTSTYYEDLFNKENEDKGDFNFGNH